MALGSLPALRGWAVGLGQSPLHGWAVGLGTVPTFLGCRSGDSPHLSGPEGSHLQVPDGDPRASVSGQAASLCLALTGPQLHCNKQELTSGVQGPHAPTDPNSRGRPSCECRWLFAAGLGSSGHKGAALLLLPGLPRSCRPAGPASGD